MQDVDDFEKDSNRRLFAKEYALRAKESQGKEHVCTVCQKSTRNGYAKLCDQQGKRYFCWLNTCQDTFSEEIKEFIRYLRGRSDT
jgi:hypothetical protein